MAGEVHLVPFRTQKLSPRAPMVLRRKSVGEQDVADQQGAFCVLDRGAITGWVMAPLFCIKKEFYPIVLPIYELCWQKASRFLHRRNRTSCSNYATIFVPLGIVNTDDGDQRRWHAWMRWPHNDRGAWKAQVSRLIRRGSQEARLAEGDFAFACWPPCPRGKDHDIRAWRVEGCRSG